MIEIKNDDITVFLKDGEIPETVMKAKVPKIFYVEIAALALLAVLTIAGDCFLIGAAFWTSLVKISKTYLAVFIPCLLLHLVPIAICAYVMFSKYSKISSAQYLFCEERIILASFSGKTSSATIVAYRDITGYAPKKNSVKIFMGDDNVSLIGLTDVSSAVKIIEEKTQVYRA